MKKINFKIIAWVIVGLIVAFKLKSCHNRRLATPTQPAAGQTPANGTNKETLPPPTPEPQPQPEYHPTYKGFRYDGKFTAGPGESSYPDDGVLRHWYTLEEDIEMKEIKIAGIKDFVVYCDGPVIYNLNIQKDREIVPLRIKKVGFKGAKLGRVWDAKTQTWGEDQFFDYTKIENISSIIKLEKDPESKEAIRVQIAYPAK